MGIDTCINQDCAAKQQLTSEGILSRIKGRQRAALLIETYRKAGDSRPPAAMGFELTRRNAAGEAVTQTVVVQELLDEAAILAAHAAACLNCPANVTNADFGCFGHLPYPLSRAAEEWWLAQMPLPEEPLVWLMLKQLLREMGYDGHSARALRRPAGIFFEAELAPRRQLGTLSLDGDQLFEMSFLLGPIQPPHAGVLLLISGAIERNQEADALLRLTSAERAVAFPPLPFRHDEASVTDDSTRALIAFLRSLHQAWRLGLTLSLDV